MSAWAWPQWVIIGIIVLMFVCKAVPAKDDLRGVDILIWVAITWVLWMGGFWP